MLSNYAAVENKKATKEWDNQLLGDGKRYIVY